MEMKNHREYQVKNDRKACGPEGIERKLAPYLLPLNVSAQNPEPGSSQSDRLCKCNIVPGIQCVPSQSRADWQESILRSKTAFDGNGPESPLFSLQIAAISSPLPAGCIPSGRNVLCC